MCALFAHQCNNFQKLIFSQLLHFKEGITSTAKKSAVSLTVEFRTKPKHRILTCARSAHECNSFQSSYFVQLLHFKEPFRADVL